MEVPCTVVFNPPFTQFISTGGCGVHHFHDPDFGASRRSLWLHHLKIPAVKVIPILAAGILFRFRLFCFYQADI